MLDKAAEARASQHRRVAWLRGPGEQLLIDFLGAAAIRKYFSTSAEFLLSFYASKGAYCICMYSPVHPQC